ncbi:MAG: F0F1 ATP synthase subunit gamma [Burkholderiales bacterium]|nr:F0F1 ATP synthase subunit gamma [Burkholderiales bacterium]MDE2564293.1 F0F1 ATP synthase subunit gamma [Burkholderiales bacterium]
MEQQAADLQARRATVSAFGDLVNAMRGVAAARERRARALIAGADAYARTVERAMAQALALQTPDARPDGVPDVPARQPPLAIVFCAEQGFNGAFSEQVLAELARGPAARVMLLGSQGLRLARARGIEPEWSAPLIAHAEAAVSAGDELHEALARALLRRAAPAVDLVHAELESGARFNVRRSRLLPLDRAAIGTDAGPAPLTHLAPQRLLDELASEYVAARLARALLHSHAAENLARLQAMAAAHENVGRMVETLEADERQLRQEAITAEIVELAAGFRALRDE